MKIFKLIPVTCFLCALFSCSQSGHGPATSQLVNTGHLKPGKYFYAAAFEKDSAQLSFNINANGKIAGQLSVRYSHTDSVAANRESTAGNFTGEFKGDTLYADYYFVSGPDGKTKYINPVALLHKGDTLIMGHGRIYYYLGRTYFDDKIPIDYTRSKFRFLPVNLKHR